MTDLLSVRELSVLAGAKPILHPLSFTVSAGETVAVTGESGSGKSTLARALMRLLPDGFKTSGQIIFEGQDLAALPERDFRDLRGRRIAMVFQEPMTALNPIRRIGKQIGDTLKLHGALSSPDIATHVQQLLDRVGLSHAGVSAQSYPHALSGGQRQRVLLAMAIACKPALLIADEFTTALDSRTQAEVMDLVQELAVEHEMGILMISHDLGVIRRQAQRVLVLQQGHLVESNETEQLFDTPRHPYTRALLGMSLHGTNHPPLTRIPVPVDVSEGVQP
ncbi:ABC transporter dipeptide transport DppD [Gluconobacter thailandicus F149-1 = NBRC 100600]|uniref:Peptide ABC transporter ATP-binding protein n=1 Tax=Gluconobacter thailandicus NBRC 3257 TaxID=1381097 RepID=A0ABQ0IZV6_GLUTH|nr:ABC transporter ATP-binding protein [Gluconobacter thailandicus]KXV52775.1 peptide ABC transporter ATP-binding protein [Gluconobacter thailandicus]GAC88202.1 peptide ABC transporter ATP-binding protein [Gluconobacter thailandicus NBRC 3255]GAD27730.1 peptide ABC transporter ATP-binding protein [Gluconobacter thailandicus NBRC 3257]GAN93196.1 ABC transporter dipeptide transport DppD [Gluconobacter thailandicus F149-1 = NBRC 100600]GBR58488.1 peptide ABC transporter ATP-binding protein [Gluco